MRVWATAVLALVLVGCGAEGDVGPADVTVSAELVQYRSDEALHRVQVKVTNGGDTATVVDRFLLTLPGFADVPAREPDARLEAGRRVDLPLVFGTASCDGAEPVAVRGTPSVRLWLDGSTDPVEVEAADPGGLVPRLAAEECAQRAVTDVVPLAFADTWTAVGNGAVTGTLQLGEVHGPARLVRVDGTTLFGIAPVSPLPIELGEAVDVPVTLRPQRCDPHAVADSSRGYAFRVGVALGDAEPVLVTVDVDPAERGVLDAALREHCGL